MATKPRIRICADCKKAPAKGIRSKRCLRCHNAHLRAKTLAWNKRRSEEARKGWSPICEYDGCENKKPNNRVATKWCDYHKELLRKQYQKDYRQRALQKKIENPGKCQNAGCDQDAFSYRSKYCSPCRAEIIRASKRMYSEVKRESHDEKNVQIIQFVRDRLNEVINEAAQTGKLQTMECHKMATVLLQLRAWNSK